ncbi:MAG TPA: dockerin type I domain-containing protein, partial [Gemmatimonadaceae bacterium]
VAFNSGEPDLVPDDTNGAIDTFVYDRCPDGSCDSAPPTITPTATSTPPPPPPKPVVVLVHGYDFDAPLHGATCGMDDMITPLTNAGFEVHCLSYNLRSSGVVSGASQLDKYIKGLPLRGRKVDLVAHSMGGLVSRWCLQFMSECRANVRSLTMVATPNYGSNLAVPLCGVNALWWELGPLAALVLHDPAACDMVPSSPVLSALNASPGPPAGVSYHLIAGDVGNTPLLGIPNDCLVELRSARGPFTPPLVFGASHTAPNIITALLFCQSPGELAATPVQTCVVQIIATQADCSGSGGGGSAQPASNAVPADIATATPTPTQEPSAPPPGTIGSASGVIQQGATFDLPVTVPAGQPTATFVFQAPSDPNASLTYTLLRPGGTPVADGDADAAISSGTGFGGTQETDITMTNPAAGTWTMRVTGTLAPSTGWPYDLQAVVPNGPSVTAQAGEGHYDTGEVVPLSATIAGADASPLTGASVSATLTKPDLSTESAALSDNGDGTYSGRFTDTSACGIYQVVISASGSDAGTAFARQDRTVVTVGVPGSRVGDPCVADQDGDGLTDAQEVDTYHTDPLNADTDADGYTDAQEVAAGKDPLTYCAIMRADVNGDATVNILDLIQVAGSFLETVPPAPARLDQNGDGKINLLDLIPVANAFLENVSACP